MTSFLFSCREGETGLSIAMAQEPPSFDVMVNTSISGREILVGNVFEKLLAYDEGEIVPLLAESYSSEDDGCTLRFRIRKGVLFHDGSPMTVSDAVASMNRWLSYSDAAEKIVKGSRFTVDGDDIVITSTSTLSLLPALIATSSESAVIFRASDIPSDGGIITSEIGTGPYKVLDYSLGEKISLGLFDEYHGEKPSISRLDYYFVSDPVTRRLGLESGTYDFIDTVSSDDIPVLSGREEVNVISGTENGSIALLFNKKNGISSSHDFRKGVSLLINRDELMKACYGEYGYNIDSSYMEKNGIWYVDPSSDPYGEENREKADTYLSEYKGQKVRILTSNLTGLDRIAVALFSQLRAYGIEAEITVLDWAAFLERRKDSDAWDIAVTALTAVSLPLDKAFLSSDYPGWTDSEEISALLEEIASSESFRAASELWGKAQILCWDYIPAIVLGHYSTTHAVSSSIEGVKLSADGFDFRSAYISE